MYDAVHRALDAGAHVVLASGRSPHGMTRIADLLDLHAERRRPALGRGLATAPCVFRYPPLEVVHEETFDAAAGRARRSSSGTRPRWSRSRSAASATGSTRTFPDGELSGDMILTDVDDLVAEPVSRVIIRDPDATADDFVELAGRARPARHRLRRRLDRLARPRAGRASPRRPAWRTSPTSSASTAADVLAIGDGRNDIEMLQWAGRGVAMGQAIQEVHRRGRRRHRQRLRGRRRDRARRAGSPSSVSLPPARRHRPRRHPGPLRRHRVAVHPRRARRRRGARRAGRVRDRPAAALGRGGLRVRRRARPRGRLQRRAGLGRRARRGRTWCGRSPPTHGARGLPS